MTDKYFLPAGSVATDDYSLSITPESAGWQYCGLRVVELYDSTHAFDTGDAEVVILPLSGSADVTIDSENYSLAGRTDVFTAVTDFAYAPHDSSVTVKGSGRFALCSGRAQRRLEPRYVPASEVAVELRGAGQASRQINNFCGPDMDFADALIAVEVLTPNGNWFSYPPHKHDEDIPGVETPLEEIYYFDVSRGGFGYQRVYGREIDVLAEVRPGDAIVMPSGYHGPSMAAPGYDLYYLIVMADWPQELFERRVWHVRRPLPKPEALARAVELLRSAKRPLIVAGGGTIYSEACSELSEFALATGIPVAETQAGKGSAPYDHPHSVGAVGATGSTVANALAREADVVLGIGTRWSDFTTASQSAFACPDVRFICLNVAPSDALKQSAIELVADARRGLEALRQRFEGWRADADWTEHACARGIKRCKVRLPRSPKRLRYRPRAR